MVLEELPLINQISLIVEDMEKYIELAQIDVLRFIMYSLCKVPNINCNIP